MKFSSFLSEGMNPNYGKGITFVDIDETLFRTFAKIVVKKQGKIVKELSNAEFNAYKLEKGEEFDFGQFRDATLFRKTSIPIEQTVNRVKRMLAMLKKNDRGSMIVFLTARGLFGDMKEFFDTFRDHGIDVDSENVKMELSGELKHNTVDERKKYVIMKYLQSGEYRRVRMVDDYEKNVQTFMTIARELPKEVDDAVRKRYNLDPGERTINFYGLLVQPDGSLKNISHEDRG